MIKTLVSVDVDLASSIAIRFACQLGNILPMEIQPVHIKESSHGPPTGAGWASRTWEKEILREGKEEITDLISSEMGICPVVNEPWVIKGSRETELARIFDQQPFDLFVEGVHFDWTPAMVHRKLSSKLYQRLPCPSILARRFMEIRKILVVCPDLQGTLAFVEAFVGFWPQCPLPIHLLIPYARKNGKQADAPAAKELQGPKRVLEEAGCKVFFEDAAELGPEGPEQEFFTDYGLVGVPVPRTIRKDHHVFQWLMKIIGPVLIVRT